MKPGLLGGMVLSSPTPSIAVHGRISASRVNTTAPLANTYVAGPTRPGDVSDAIPSRRDAAPAVTRTSGAAPPHPTAAPPADGPALPRPRAPPPDPTCPTRAPLARRSGGRRRRRPRSPSGRARPAPPPAAPLPGPTLAWCGTPPPRAPPPPAVARRRPPMPRAGTGAGPSRCARPPRGSCGRHRSDGVRAPQATAVPAQDADRLGAPRREAGLIGVGGRAGAAQDFGQLPLEFLTGGRQRAGAIGR